MHTNDQELELSTGTGGVYNKNGNQLLFLCPGNIYFLSS